MDEEEHRRAEEEMKELHLHHHQRRNEKPKFGNRLISTLYKALVLALVLGFFCFWSSQSLAFIRLSGCAVLARQWSVAVKILLLGVLVFLVTGRGHIAEPDGQDSAPKSIGLKHSALDLDGYKDSPQIPNGYEAVSNSGYQSSHKSEEKFQIFQIQTLAIFLTPKAKEYVCFDFLNKAAL